MAEEKTFSAKQVATRIGTEAKTLRKFFRDANSGYKAVGQGGRYDFPESELPEIREKFNAWNKGKVKRNRPTNAERAAAAKAKPAVPRQRKEAPEEPRVPRRSRNAPPPSPLDEDDLLTRCRSSIGERAKARGVTTDRTGRWVKAPELMAVIQDLADRERAKKAFDSMLEEVLEEQEEPTEEELAELGQEEYDALIDSLEEAEDE